MQKAIIITGQTGSGKTFRALQEAKRLDGEILNADARQIYKHLTIVTGKDVGSSTFVHFGQIALENNRIADIGYYTIDSIRMWGYDLVDPSTHFSSYDYKVVANFILRNAIDKMATPIIVGGTHLYIKHLLQDFDVTVGPDWELRDELEKLSVKQLQDKLVATSSQIFESMNPSDQANPRRLIRRIEIALAGTHKTEQEQEPHIEPVSYSKKIGLRFTSTEQCRMILQRRIADRLAQGAMSEVEQILNMGHDAKDPGMQTIGYKELLTHLQGKTSFEEAKELWLNAEVQYAKRQLSFMKQDSEIEWHMI